MAGPKVLVTGATGFVGGSVLAQLLASTDPAIQELSVKTIVRQQGQADVLARNGVEAILFNGLDDAQQLRQIASDFDIVLHCATGQHTASAEALVLGLGDSMKKSGRQAHYIHTTGTSNLAYSIVSHPGTSVSSFSDADDDVYEEEVRRDAQQFYEQRRTDLTVISTAEKTGVKPYLMMPPTIYGRGMGYFKTQSDQIPTAVRHAIKQGHPEYIGDGSGTVGYVHIADLSALYELVLSKVLADTDVPSGRKGYYFSNTGSFTWKGLNEKIGEIGVRLGALGSGTPVSVPFDQAVTTWSTGKNRHAFEINFSGRSETTPKNAYALGWKPEKTAKDWDEEIEETWKAILAERA